MYTDYKTENTIGINRNSEGERHLERLDRSILVAFGLVVIALTVAFLAPGSAFLVPLFGVAGGALGIAIAAAGKYKKDASHRDTHPGWWE